MPWMLDLGKRHCPSLQTLGEGSIHLQVPQPLGSNHTTPFAWHLFLSKEQTLLTAGCSLKNTSELSLWPKRCSTDGGTSYLFLASICQIPGEGEPFALSLCISIKEEKKNQEGKKSVCCLFPCWWEVQVGWAVVCRRRRPGDDESRQQRPCSIILLMWSNVDTQHRPSNTSLRWPWAVGCSRWGTQARATSSPPAQTPSHARWAPSASFPTLRSIRCFSPAWFPAASRETTHSSLASRRWG